jgi:hypothetical protein
MSRPKPKIAGQVHIVLGTLPWEFTTVMSVWTTPEAAKAEEQRLEKLESKKRKTTDEEVELKGAEVFAVEAYEIRHAGGPL